VTDKTSYRESGVDIDAQDEALREVRRIARTTFTPNVASDIGSFGGLFRASFEDMSKPILVSSTDGVGTKLRVAQAMKIHDTVGYDLVCHCVNDILVQGARPLFFLDYYATGKLRPPVMTDVIRGMARACSENGCALIGGETAEMPGFYGDDDYDIAGFIVGVVDESKLLDEKQVREGDVLIALPSAGLHTNGYSLARRVFLDKLGHDYQTVLPEIGKIGEALLQPHISYLKPLMPLIDQKLVHALAHITGGGLTDNVPRVLPENLDAHIKLGSWAVPPIFRFLFQRGNVDRDEMLRVFNMGIGMVIIAAKEAVDPIDIRRRNDHHHADAHVEHAQHLVPIHFAVLEEELEDGQHRPRSELDASVERFGQHTRHVVREPAAGDVRERVNRALLDKRQQLLEVRDVRLQENVSCFADSRKNRLRVVSEFLEEDAASERVAVRVESDGRKADQDVALAHRFSVDEVFRVDDADDEPGDVVVIVAIKTRHFRGLAADERTAVFATRARHAANHVGHHRRTKLAGRVVIEEEQRTRALHENVVHTVADQVVANRVVNLHRLRDAEFRSHAIRRGDENRRLHPLERSAKESAERADLRHHAWRVCVADDPPDLAKRLVLRIDVHAGIPIRALVGHGGRV
jgi:phosphoribosylformylglycinamidine cyclo-ligase